MTTGLLSKPEQSSCTFPTALRPLRPIHSDESLPDLDPATKNASCNKENKKAKAVKSKKSLIEEWRSLIPPLFSVPDDLHGSQVHYGEKQRHLYSKLNQALARSSKNRHQTLYKTHEVLKKSGEKPTKSSEHNLKRRKHFSVHKHASKTLNEYSSAKSGIKLKKLERTKHRKQLSKQKSISDNHGTTDTFQKQKSRNRKCSGNSDFSVSSVDSYSSFQSCASHDVYFSSDSELWDEPNSEDDEQDLINRNIIKQKSNKEVDEIGTKTKFFQRSMSDGDRPYVYQKFNIFEVIDELSDGINDSDGSVKNEIKPKDKHSEIKWDQESPANKQKLKLQFDIFRTKLQLSNKTKQSPSETPKTKILDDKCALQQSVENHTDKFHKILRGKSDESENSSSEEEKLKVEEKLKDQWKVLQQKLRNTFHKLSNQSKDSPLINASEMPKLNRHFLDVLNKTDRKEEETLNDESSLDEESPLPLIERHKKYSTLSQNQNSFNVDEEPPLPIIERRHIVRKNKFAELQDFTSSIVDDESPLPVIEWQPHNQSLEQANCKNINANNVDDESPSPVIEFLPNNISLEQASCKNTNTNNLESESPLPMIEFLPPSQSVEQTSCKNTNNLENESPLPVIEFLPHSQSVEQASCKNTNTNNLENESTLPVIEFLPHSQSIEQASCKNRIPNNVNDESPLPVIELQHHNLSQEQAIFENVTQNDVYEESPLPVIERRYKRHVRSQREVSKIDCTDEENISDNIQIHPEETIEKTSRELMPVVEIKQTNSKTDESSDVCPSLRKSLVTNIEYNNNITVPIYDCSILLKQLKIQTVKQSHVESPDNEIARINANISKARKRSRSGSGQKTKVSCKAVPSQEYNLLCNSSSMSSLANTQISHSIKHANQPEKFLQEFRIDCQPVPDNTLPFSHSTIILQGCKEDIGLQHNIEFLKYFCVHYKPTCEILSQMIETAFFCDISKELVIRTYCILQQICFTLPSCFSINWEMLQSCLDVIVHQHVTDSAPASEFQASLLLKLAVQVLRIDLYSRYLGEYSEIRKSIAYFLFSYDEHSPLPRYLIQYLKKLLNKWDDHEDSVCDHIETVMELLEIAVEISSDYMINASHLAGVLKCDYIDLPSLERKHFLLSSMKSDLLRYKLTEVLLESQYSGTTSIPTRVAETCLQILLAFSKVSLKISSQGNLGLNATKPLFRVYNK